MSHFQVEGPAKLMEENMLACSLMQHRMIRTEKYGFVFYSIKTLWSNVPWETNFRHAVMCFLSKNREAEVSLWVCLWLLLSQGSSAVGWVGRIRLGEMAHAAVSQPGRETHLKAVNLLV